MTLPASGPISLGNVRTELAQSGAISLGQASVRNLLGVPSGPIPLANARGKSAVIRPTVAANYGFINPDRAVDGDATSYACIEAWADPSSISLAFPALASSGTVRVKVQNLGKVADADQPSSRSPYAFIVGMSPQYIPEGNTVVLAFPFTGPKPSGLVIEVGAEHAYDSDNLIRFGSLIRIYDVWID